MLGWEFPPRIAGGLGVACHGLTRALDFLGHEVTFVLPRPPAEPLTSSSGKQPGDAVHSVQSPVATKTPGRGRVGFRYASFLTVPSRIASPYAGGARVGSIRLVHVGEIGAPSTAPVTHVTHVTHVAPVASPHSPISSTSLFPSTPSDLVQAEDDRPVLLDPLLSGRAIETEAHNDAPGVYAFEDVGDETERYMRLVVSMARREKFDVIHAHDWPTFPAGAALSLVSGKPLIAHVHSTEFDRSPGGINQRIADIERAGVLAADRVVAVSQLTRGVLVRKYGVSPAHVDVIYNGVDRTTRHSDSHVKGKDRIVLFVGRLTSQKGPEYFIAAAKRVLEKVPDVKFVLAGSGDLMLRMATLANQMGIGRQVLFTGFLSQAEVDKVYSMAECFVMPSVSEPFGLAALEAIDHDVPVIVSRTSGACEVLRHVLKVDFWDTQEMANKIVAVLTRPALGATLRANAGLELHKLSWEAAAMGCVSSYQKALDARAARN